MTMTAQEVFDKAATHLLTQKAKSIPVDGSSQCLYRGPNGLQCVAGPFIPDSLYSPRMEGSSISGVLIEFPEVREYVGESNEALLQNLQDIHDARSVDSWRIELRQLAKSRNLDDNVIDTIL